MDMHLKLISKKQFRLGTHGIYFSIVVPFYFYIDDTMIQKWLIYL